MCDDAFGGEHDRAVPIFGGLGLFVEFPACSLLQRNSRVGRTLAGPAIPVRPCGFIPGPLLSVPN